MQSQKRKQCYTEPPQDSEMHVGQRLKRLMKKEGITPSAMAAHCEVTAGAVSNWFATGRITKPNLLKAAKLLGVTPEALILGPAGDRGAEAPDMPAEMDLSATERALVLAFREQLKTMGAEAEAPWCQDALLLAREIQRVKPELRRRARRAAASAIVDFLEDTLPADPVKDHEKKAPQTNGLAVRRPTQKREKS